MTGARLWWVRHGPTHARAMVGWTDLPADLSDQTRLDRLSAYLPAQATIVSSDLDRARATADALAAGRRRLPHMRDLREMHFGTWENRTFADVEAEDPDGIFRFWDAPGETRAPRGESWNDLAARVGAAADRLAETGGDIVVVAHFGAILSQVARARGLSAKDAFAQHIDNLSVTVIDHAGGTLTAAPVNHVP